MVNENLYSKRKDCCGCGACVSACLHEALTLQEDEYGFLYPNIQEHLCVDCGACKKICAFKIHELNDFPIQIYAVSIIDRLLASYSASGGVFAALALKVIQDGGVVYGAACFYENKEIHVRHIGINRESELKQLQGSKYVQSIVGDCYQEIHEWLKQGRKVLFSGTPCQVAAIKKYTWSKTKLLFLVDIICHGVPNQQMFRDFLKVKEKKWKGVIVDFNFRAKDWGWGYLLSKVHWKKENGKVGETLCPAKFISYYKLFLEGLIYRESCYECPYAQGKRCGDLTLGDYWGVDIEQPELLQENGGRLKKKQGISCVLVNNDKGSDLLEHYKEQFVLETATFEQVARVNTQLQKPVSMQEQKYSMWLELYKKKGWIAVEKQFGKQLGLSGKKYYIKCFLKKYLPRKLSNIYTSLRKRSE